MAINSIAKQLHDSSTEGEYYREAQVNEDLAFLPAARTWIEWKDKDGTRNGVLLEEAETEDKRQICLGSFASVSKNEEKFGSVPEWKMITFALRGGRTEESFGRDCIRFPKNTKDRAWHICWAFWCYAALAFINTPRVIARIQHMPHRGLERDLIKAKAMVGKFPLLAWTEIKLKINETRIDGEVHEDHLTGEKVLHFCRSHLRIRFGKLEIVRAHWRGNPALGIKQSGYVLTN